MPRHLDRHVRHALALALALALAVAHALLIGHGQAMAQAHAHAHAHEHGAVSLSIGVEADTLTLLIEAPLDSLVGYEHAPRTAAQKAAAQALLARLRAPATLFTPDAAAGCTPAEFEVDPGVLEPAAASTAPSDGHAELEASYRWTCARPDAVRSIDLAGLMKAAPRIARVGAQIATAQGKFKASLKRPATVLRWGR
ncbi:ZrgA family zinc uptake protein [Sphaerotilus mobilis]|uniref:Uncharacterized protein DUF2796 n=1 Tax=Sphaerotilus mobilis TaxID=47994 RepID=A0A4Q7LGR2_9BURK|nr:DUF2796 domain-containing protein [Sphaerotilus mobilis]RZS53213.1 uncharacterized protein DUF2796 [Sphaerotilus mobilis]